MSQRAFLADMEATLHDAFASAGMADIGHYLPPNAAPGDEPVPCRVYVDRDISTVGGMRQVVRGRVEVAYVLAPGLVPVQHGAVSVDGDLYINDKPVSDDGSLARWQVYRG